MKKRNFLACTMFLILMGGCSSTKLANAYKSDTFKAIKNKEVLVISRTPQDAIRKAYENEISKRLKAKGLHATASHFVFPNLKPLTNKTVDRIANTISKFRKEGFDIIVLTSLKDVKEQEVLKREEGYSSMLEYYGNKYLTLKGYYDDLSAPPKLPPRETKLEPITEKTVTFILEAVTYDLSLPEEQRLLSVITTEITNPNSGSSVRKGFAKLITENLQ